MEYTRLQQIAPFPGSPYAPPPHITALAFDPYANLVHLGSAAGSIATVAHPAALARYVTYPAHGAIGAGPFGTNHAGLALGGGGPVHAIRVVEKEVRALTEGGVGARLRNGPGRWSIDDPSHGLRTFSSNPLNSHELIAGGVGGQLMVINAARGQVVKSLEQPHALCQIDSTRTTILAASSTGHIQLLDPRQNMRATNSLSSASTFAGGLSGFDLLDNAVLTWGWTVSQGQLVQDTTLKLFDVRTLRSSGTVLFEAGPTHAKLHRGQPNLAVVCSNEGYVEVVDVWAGHRHSGLQLECTSPISAMAISEQGTYAAFAEYDGPLHLYTSQDLSNPALLGNDGLPELEPFNGHRGAAEVDWPSLQEPVPAINWTEQTPLNVIGMPLYTEKLASNLPPQAYMTHSSPLVRPPPKIPREVLATVRLVDSIGYAPLPRDLRGKRNVVCKNAQTNLMSNLRDAAGAGPRGPTDATQRRESGPRFRSERERHDRAATEELWATENGVSAAHMPKSYRKVEIKYSRFGVEDFDFEYYNHTRYSGLETHITNSYTNSVLQALHYLVPIRRYAKSHIRRECNKEHCMLCESGFLFRMLEDAQGTNCQASNFSRAFSSTSQASSLGLFMRDEEETAPDVAGMIQKFTRWLLATYSEEAKLVPGPSSAAADSLVTGFVSRKVDTCAACGKEAARDATIHAIDLQYPRKVPGQDAAANQFVSILEISLRRDNSSKATCSFCKRVVQLHSHRIFPDGIALPPILTINASILQDEHRDFWRDRPGARPAAQRRFLPSTVRLDRSRDGEMRVLPDASADSPVGQEDGLQYQIQSLVVEVGTEGSAPHLVSLVRSPAPAADTGDGSWLLFNDFLVKEITEDEALSFVGEWKTPAIVFYQRVDTMTGVPSPIVEDKDTDILHRDACISQRDTARVRHRILQEDEVPKPGTMISIDAEFVALQMEELEIRSDGTKQVLRPSKMSLARVSVLRGDGPSEGEPFIDDYIHTSENIANYLTEFSGIKEGDLNPQVSPYTVVPLKVAYKKLRLLVDLGCTFVGHGLSKDFRTINIYVPPKQVIDTVNIFYDPARHRKLSLRFLSWFLLKQEIQTAEHDSIEDARSALLLYRMYQSFVADKRFDDVMEDIFEAGKRLGFKPPLPAAASEQAIQVQADQPNVTKVTSSGPPRERNDRRGRGMPGRSGR